MVFEQFLPARLRDTNGDSEKAETLFVYKELMGW